MHSAATLNRIGGRLCLDFVNTAAYRQDIIANEHLKTLDDVIDWGLAASMLEATSEAILRTEIRTQSSGASVTLMQVLKFRAVLRELIDPALYQARSDRQHRRFANDLHRGLSDGLHRTSLTVTGNGKFALTGNENHTDWLIVPVALSAAALLTSPDLAAVRACEGDGCGWLFLDSSPGSRRRWCAMEPCGNRIKARSHYLRHRAKSAPRQPRRGLP